MFFTLLAEAKTPTKNVNLAIVFTYQFFKESHPKKTHGKMLLRPLNGYTFNANNETSFQSRCNPWFEEVAFMKKITVYKCILV